MAHDDRVPAIDLFMGLPFRDIKSNYKQHQPLLKDPESRDMTHPADYMFKELPPAVADDTDPVTEALVQMDRNNVELGLIDVATEDAQRALRDFPKRFWGYTMIDPNDIAGAIAQIRHAHEAFGIRAVMSFPAGCHPQVAVNDRKYYPIYQLCIDLNLPISVNAGVAGPRFPSSCQNVMHFDDVCYDFPALKIIMRHGAEPWEDLAVKLMLKWPGLFYMPSAFAPKYYPSAIIDYANSRGAHKIMYAGYYPWGLTLDRIFTEMPSVPFDDSVWPKFLRENALSVMGEI